MDDCTLAFLVSGLIALCGAGRLKILQIVSYHNYFLMKTGTQKVT